MAVDARGNVLIADTRNHRVRSLGADGTIRTVAGNGRAEYARRRTPATEAALNGPAGLAADAQGNIYISDTLNNRIRVVLATPPSFQIAPSPVTLTGSAGQPSVTGSFNVLSTVAGLRCSVAVDAGRRLVGARRSARLRDALRAADRRRRQRPPAPGQYTGTVTVTTPLASPPAQQARVALTVLQAQPSKLAVGSLSVTFGESTGAGSTTRNVSVFNQGGGVLAFEA